MAMPIFTKGSCARYQLYDRLVQIIGNAGWQPVSTNVTQASNTFRSSGENGKERLEFQMMPYDANTSSSWNDTYDCRNQSGNRSRGIIRFSSYNTAGTSGDFSTWYPIPFVYNSSSSGGTPSASNNVISDPNYRMNYYYFANKDIIIMLVDPEFYTGLTPTLFAIGKLQENYLQERDNTSRISSSMTYLTTNASPGGDGTMQVADTPTVMPPASSLGYKLTSYIPEQSSVPNVDGRFTMVDLFGGISGEGIRNKLGYFYVTKNSSSILSGDFLQVTNSSGEVEKYAVFKVGSILNGLGSSYCPIIRVE